VRSEAVEFEIEDSDGLFDASTNPSLLRLAPPAARRLHGSTRRKAFQKAVAIPEEEERLS
jgi:hypothetical protein